MNTFFGSVPNNNEVYTAQTEQCSLDFKSESIKTNVYFEWFARQYTKNNYFGQSPFFKNFKNIQDIIFLKERV